MAYLTPDTPHRRVAAVSAVAAVHGVMAVALLSGFAGGVIKAIEKDYMPAWTYVDPPKPVPTVAPTAAPADSNRKAETKVDTALNQDLFPLPTGGFDPGPMPTGGIGDVSGMVMPPMPSPMPEPMRRSYHPNPRPLNNPALWVTNYDYPAKALRYGEEGLTRFEVTVGPDGRVRDCTITLSSGSAALDVATCVTVTRRARFDPAGNAHGEAIASRYASAVRWTIPED